MTQPHHGATLCWNATNTDRKGNGRAYKVYTYMHIYLFYLLTSPSLQAGEMMWWGGESPPRHVTILFRHGNEEKPSLLCRIYHDDRHDYNGHDYNGRNYDVPPPRTRLPPWHMRLPPPRMRPRLTQLLANTITTSVLHYRQRQQPHGHITRTCTT